MGRPRGYSVLGSFAVIVLSGFFVSKADDDPVAADPDHLPVAHPECDYFGPQRDKFVSAALKAPRPHRLSDVTEQVTRMMGGYIPGGSRTYTFDQSNQAGSIDSYIFADFPANGITPAPQTTDWEFVRRVTLDLTGRVPTPDAVLTFVADATLNKRAKLIDALLATPQWVDKWTMFYGDLFQNTVTKPSTGVNRFAQGRNAFYQWIHDSLANGKPYSQMASEVIAATTTNTYQDGFGNWLAGGAVLNGPMQDTVDQMAANVADTFLGVTHMNCLLCHNGRGHLDQLSLWATNTTRYQAWQFASYLSHTQAGRTPVDPSNGNIYYWFIEDNTRGYTNDYTMNTTTGNRPARVAPAGCKSGQPCYYVTPQYIFTGDSAKPGEGYRAALAREVTGDFQFARAAVNYVWAQFFGRGIVDPPDTFDPARLDPDNPPPAPWTLQPSNAKLLNALATHFVQNGYDVKSLMREITNSAAYQLSSRYPGQWNAAWEPYFARKFVRRLWSEEVHDAVAQTSGAFPTYTIAGFTDQGFSKPNFAMQFPDTVGMASGDALNLLDSFLRGNRDDQPRRQDGSILQALNLMNNSFVVNRLKTTGGTPNQLIMQNLSKTNSDLINTLFLTILSRYPSSDEMNKAQAVLAGASSRAGAAADLVWSLYNKVDFIFNY